MKNSEDKNIDANLPLTEITGELYTAESAELDLSKILMAIESTLELQSITSIRHKAADIRDQINELLRAEWLLPNKDTEYIKRSLQQVTGSQTVERAKYYLSRLIKGLTESRTNRFSDINLNRWQEYEDVYTDSLWIVDKRDRSGAHTAGYWGNFIPQIPNQLIRRFTKHGEWILDPFAGSGTSLIESQRLGRNSLGVELVSEIAAKGQDLISAEPNHQNVKSEIVLGDSTVLDFRDELNKRGIESVQLAILHPPYHDIIQFSDDPRDLSNAETTNDFLEMVGRVVANVSCVLDKGRYLGLVIGDKFSKGEWIPLGFLTSQVVTSHGFLLKSIIVKNFEETSGKRMQKQLWRYRALLGGYYIFKHEYIFLFTKI